MSPTLLLDFGAVLLPVDEKGCWQAFEALGARDSLARDQASFQALERGELSRQDFITALRPHFFRPRIFGPDLLAAWNCMVPVPIPEDTIRLLQRLRKKQRLFLVSNTNEIHLEAIAERSGPFAFRRFEKSFEACYYSHQMGLRKPEAAFFEQVITEQGLVPEDCLFIDDRAENIKAAQALGLQTHHFLPQEESLAEVLGLKNW